MIKTEGSPLPVTKCTCLGIALRSLFLGTILLIQPHPIIHPIFYSYLISFLFSKQCLFSAQCPYCCLFLVLNILPSLFYPNDAHSLKSRSSHISQRVLTCCSFSHQPGLTLAFSSTYCSHQCLLTLSLSRTCYIAKLRFEFLGGCLNLCQFPFSLQPVMHTVC